MRHTKESLAMSLDDLSFQMDHIARRMLDHDGEIFEHGEELLRAAGIAKTWSDGILSMAKNGEAEINPPKNASYWKRKAKKLESLLKEASNVREIISEATAKVPCEKCGHPHPVSGIGDREIAAVLKERDRYRYTLKCIADLEPTGVEGSRFYDLVKQMRRMAVETLDANERA